MKYFANDNFSEQCLNIFDSGSVLRARFRGLCSSFILSYTIKYGSKYSLFHILVMSLKDVVYLYALVYMYTMEMLWRYVVQSVHVLEVIKYTLE